MRRIGFCLLLLTALLTGWQLLSLGPHLPDPVASHFGANGKADGWSSRNEFLLMHAALQVGIAALMLACAFVSKWLPHKLLNMPNKEYWLHEDRRDAALARSSSMLIFVAGLTGLFLGCMFHLIYVANMQNNGQIAPSILFTMLALYLIVMGVVVWRLLRSFRLPESERQSLREALDCETIRDS